MYCFILQINENEILKRFSYSKIWDTFQQKHFASHERRKTRAKESNRSSSQESGWHLIKYTKKKKESVLGAFLNK